MELLTPPRALHEWGDISRQLARCSRINPTLNLDRLLVDLASNRCAAWRVPGGWVVTSLQSPERIFWIEHVAGALTGQTRQILEVLETFARSAKMREIRAYARKGWKRLLPDYSATAMADGRYELRKALV